jgi:hypothetical protein
MFESGFDQATGLAALRLQHPKRLLPVVQSPDPALAQAALQRLEDGLLHLGLSVLPLDGMPESGGALSPSSAWLDQWQQALPDAGVLLWQAPLEAWAVRLAGTQARPLVLLDAVPASLVNAYNAVKVLWQVAALQALVLWLPEAEPTSVRSADRDQGQEPGPVQTLRQQVWRHLGLRAAVWPLGYDRQRGVLHHAAGESCMQRVLETALVLQDCVRQPHVHSISHEFFALSAHQTGAFPDVHRQRHA